MKRLTQLKILELDGNPALEKPPGCPLDSDDEMSYTSKDEVKEFLRCLAGKKSQACLLQ